MAILRLVHKLAVGLVIDIPTQVVDDKKIQQAVIIDVEPRSPHRPERAEFFVRMSQPRFLRDIGERSIAIVVIELVSVHAAYKDVFISVVVVVSERHQLSSTQQKETWQEALKV